ncbi:ABC transporter ATP-binding protein [bacterium]|nr:ABC transporter ATP-binding protein [bacterium]
MNNTVLQARGITKEFIDGEQKLHVLRGVDLTLKAGETIAIVGDSGSGKSTLLHILGCLARPTEGELTLLGKRVESASDGELTKVRSNDLGFVFQMHYLLPEFNALENVSLRLLAAGLKPEDARKQAQELLERVGLGERLGHSPLKLSGGEQQRVAVARALVANPKIVLMDEPTGNLDQQTSDRLLELVFSLAEGLGISFLIVTHDRQLAQRADRYMTLTEGQLSS